MGTPSPQAPPVFALRDEYLEAAETIASRLGCRVLPGAPPHERQGLALLMDGRGLTLTDGKLELRGDFEPLLRRLRPRNLSHELLVKAARIKGVESPLVVDATAGLGEDSLLLAAVGFSVVLFERDRAIAELLEDALRRAARLPELAGVVSRMELRREDSIGVLPQLTTRPDVVLLDPMFPTRTKSAQVKKKFQLIHRLEGPCEDEAELLQAAFCAGPRKIVVKRPPKGPWLAEAKPSYSLAGKAVRYDVIVPPSQTDGPNHYPMARQ